MLPLLDRIRVLGILLCAGLEGCEESSTTGDCGVGSGLESTTGTAGVALTMGCCGVDIDGGGGGGGGTREADGCTL